MMDKFDSLISDALSAEDRKLMEELAEPGFFGLALGTMKGPSGWVTVVMVVAQTALFLVSVWAAWYFFAATEVLAALKWGISAAVLLLASLQLKLALMPQIQADRVILAIRRMELALMRR
jgi:alkylation response protein AidB-like acyl-CoA dehydrogenase